MNIYEVLRRPVITEKSNLMSEDGRYVFEVARDGLDGSGEIVDLGCWLGSLTCSLALGRERNPRLLASSTRVHAFDQFIWLAGYMDVCWHDGLTIARPGNGESFLPAFRFFTRRFAGAIVEHGAVGESPWTGAPIECLSVDAMKTPPLAQRILTEFFPKLVPGGWLFHQDFCHYYTWWIHVYHFALRRHFEIDRALEGSSGVLFRLIAPLTQDDLDRAVAIDLGDSALADEAFAFSLEQVATLDRGAVAAAHVWYEVRYERFEKARDLARRYEVEPGFAAEIAHAGPIPDVSPSDSRPT